MKITIAISDDVMRKLQKLSAMDMEMVREINDKSLVLGSRRWIGDSTW